MPDLAVEIISRTNTGSEIKKKIREYFQVGVRRVWVVYPETTEIEDYDAPTSVRIIQTGDVLEAGTLWPGVSLEVARLFANPEPAP